MATGVTLYKSTDTSAPTLSGTAGDLVTLLDAILVNGYGAKPAAGWTKPFAGTNTAVYRMGGGNQFYLNVLDNAPGAAGAQEARMRGYEVATAVSTGTGLFPTAAQLANGVFVRKSAAASGTTRVWCAVADNRTLYLFINTGDALGYTGFIFGDFYSFLVGDNYRSIIIGRTTENNATATPEQADRINAGVTANIAGHYIARTYTGLGTAVAAGKSGDFCAGGGASYLGGGQLVFPNSADGGFYSSPVYIQETAGTVRRGKLRGFTQNLHNNTGALWSDGDTLSVGTKSYILIGRTFQSASSWYCIETSDTWDTSV